MDTLSTSIWQDIFGVSNETAFSTIVPAIIAILIFLLGFFFRWIGNRIKIHIEYKQKREFVFSQVNVLINALCEQRTAINKFIASLQVDKTQSLEFELKVAFNPKHIFQIGSNELFEVFVLSFWRNKEARLEVFNSLLKQLDLIEGLRIQYKESFEYTLRHKSDFENKWNDNIKIIRELHDDWKIEFLRMMKNPSEDEFLYGFNQLYLRYVSTKDYQDMYVAVPNFINETLKYTRPRLTNVFAHKILNYLLGCLEAYDNHKHLRNFKIEEFQQYLTQLDEIEIKLKNFLKFYNYDFTKG